jgi:hypothetical protein
MIEENRDSLKPPVENKNLYKDVEISIVMIVAGPNARKDYHHNETESILSIRKETFKLCTKNAQRHRQLSCHGMTG